jgi:hypothetical protein
LIVTVLAVVLAAWLFAAGGLAGGSDELPLFPQAASTTAAAARPGSINHRLCIALSPFSELEPRHSVLHTSGRESFTT